MQLGSDPTEVVIKPDMVSLEKVNVCSSPFRGSVLGFPPRASLCPIGTGTQSIMAMFQVASHHMAGAKGCGDFGLVADPKVLGLGSLQIRI